MARREPYEKGRTSPHEGRRIGDDALMRTCRWLVFSLLALAAVPAGGRVVERVSVDSTGHQGNGDSLSPAISADGSYVAFTSAASNLVSGDTNGFEDVFVSTANTPTPTPTPTGTPRPTATPGSCIGDCTGKGQVTVDDILTMINIALGNTPVGNCLAGDANSDGQITVDEILTAVNNALNGCGG